MATILIAPEYDDDAVRAVKWALVQIGAEKVGGSWGVVGSQEVAYEDWSIGSAVVRLEAETYVGLTLDGPKELVERASRIALERLGRTEQRR